MSETARRNIERLFETRFHRVRRAFDDTAAPARSVTRTVRPRPVRPHSASVFLLASFAAAVLVLASSCSRGESPRTPSSAPAAEATAAVIGANLRYDPSVPVNGGEPIVIEFWTQADYEEIHRRLVNDYMEMHPNVVIRLTALSWSDLRSRLTASLEFEIGPELFHMHNSMSGQLIPHLEPYPQDTFPLDALDRDFRQVRSHIVDGRLYFIDTGLMTSAIFYNRGHWAEAGLTEADFPRTWDELYETAQRLTVRGENGEIVRAGFNPNSIGFALLTALNLQQGVPMFSFAEPRRPVLAVAESVRSLEYIRRFYEEPAVADTRLPEFHESLAFGSASMIYAWGWVANWLEQFAPETDFGIFRLPTWDGTEPPAYDRNNGEISMGVNRYAEPAHRTVSFDIIRFFLASDEYLFSIASSFGTAPSKITLDSPDDALHDPRLEPFQAILERTVWPGAFPQMYEDHIVKYLIDPVILDGADIRTALLATDRVLEPLMRWDRFISLESRYSHNRDFSRTYRFLE